MEASSYPALSVVVVREEVWGGWSPQQGGDYWLCSFNVRLNPVVFCGAVCVAFRFLLYLGQCPIEKAIVVPKMLLKLWGLIPIAGHNGFFLGYMDSLCVRNNTGRAAATIAFRATVMSVKVSIDSCLGQQHCVKIFSNRLPFEKYIFITVDLYLLIKAMALQWYRSMPIDQFNRFARASIDIYCSTKQVRKDIDRHLQNATDVKNFLFRLEFLWKTGCFPQYLQYKEVTFLFFPKNLCLELLISDS